MPRYYENLERHVRMNQRARRASAPQIWLVQADRANGTTDTYPEQFESEAAAAAALARIKVSGENWLQDGDVGFVGRQW